MSSSSQARQGMGSLSSMQTHCRSHVENAKRQMPATHGSPKKMAGINATYGNRAHLANTSVDGTKGMNTMLNAIPSAAKRYMMNSAQPVVTTCSGKLLFVNAFYKDRQVGA